MFYLYADGHLISQPLEESLIVLSPRLILELGKAGSFEFSIPPTNTYYGEMRKLKTIITVNLDDTELFRGRVLSHDRNFNNVKKIYAEGELAYLVDSVQKTERYSGTTHDLFRRAIAAHNAQTDPEKRFVVGNITIEDRDIIITGTSEEFEDLETGAFDYKQIAINATSNDWPTTYDYIQSNIIEYCGGYLMTRRENGVTYIDLVSETGNSSIQDIQFGTNVLDITEEATAEEVFTVLIPIGDENLTIESVNNGSRELVDEAAKAEYGRIVKTRVFENVTDPNTLLENGRRFLANHENVPVTFTVKAVDMHLIDKDVSEIRLGDSVLVYSQPHGISMRLVCTRIEYDLENPANNTYTFGNPKQTLTQRYRQDKRKEENDSSGSGGSGGAGSAADEKAKENLDKFYDAWINVDEENAHIDLGAVYKELKDGKEVLKQQVGIDLDAPTGHINIYALRDYIDQVDGRVTRNSAEIDLWANDLKSQIDAHAAWAEEFEGQTKAWHAQLILEANKNGEAIAKLQTTHENRIAQLELKSTELEASALMKATYDANRTADLKLISNLDSTVASLSAAHNGRLASLETKTSELEASALMKATYDANRTADLKLISNLDSTVASLSAAHNGRLASLETSVSDLKSSVVMKATYDTKIASIEATATSQGSLISANADAIKTKASTYTLNTKVAEINADIVAINAELTTVKKLVADEIDAVKGDVTWLTAKTLKVTGLTVDNLYANNYVSAPAIRMGGRTVATEKYVDDKVANFVTSTWVSDQGFATKSYVDDRNAWGSSTATGKFWCKVGGTSKVVALGNHTHSDYCTEARVKELIAAASIPWGNISGKPSYYAPKSHRHSFSFSKSIANGHTHKVTVNGTTYTSQGVSVNATHSLSVEGNTGYYGG